MFSGEWRLILQDIVLMLFLICLPVCVMLFAAISANTGKLVDVFREIRDKVGTK